MKNFALVNKTNNLVENVIIWDGTHKIDLPTDFVAIEIPKNENFGEWSMIGPGWSWVNGVFTEPPKPVHTVVPLDDNGKPINQPISTGSQTL
jgi:hypothetical protein